MDTKEDILKQLREGLKNYTPVQVASGGYPDGDEITVSFDDSAYSDVIDLGSNVSDSMILSTGTYSWPSGTTISPNVYVNGTGTGWTGPNIAATLDDLTFGSNRSAKITLTGEDADIDINGVSLCDTIRGIQDRLNILCPDPGMEQEWDDLRAIREQYEAKLQECREKSRAWKALKQMPPSDIR